MTAEQLEELLKLWEKGFRISIDNEEAVNVIKRVIAAEKLVEATGELCRRVEQQQNGCPMRADHVPNALLLAQEALTAYREASK